MCNYVILALAILVPPAPPTITLTVEPHISVEKGDFVVVHATTNGKHVKWIADPNLRMLPSEISANEKVFVAIPKAVGQFKVMAYSSLDDELSEPAVCVIDVTLSAPAPAPASASKELTPKEIVAPVQKDAWIIYITDGEPEYDKTFWSTLTKNVIVCEKSDKVSASNGYNTYVEKSKTGYPALLFLQKDGTFIKAISLPKSKDAVVEEVHKVIGS